MKKIIATIFVMGVISFAASINLPNIATAENRLISQIQNGFIRIEDLERSFLYYVPKDLKEGAPLVFVFHGGGIDAEKMREITAYEFERLAELHHFIVAYPNGFEKSWNGCRKKAPYPANEQNIEDPEFVRALIRHFHGDFKVDTSAIFAMGFSNGGHLAYRLALEMPNEIAAIAAVGANLPAEENCDCFFSNSAVAVMIVNGTDDPINPFDGGEVKLPNGANLGAVLSTMQTAGYFRRIAGHAKIPSVFRYPDGDENDTTSVERLSWDGADLPEVTLLKINGGGHTIPQAKFRFPEIYGTTNSEVNSLEEIWKFFQRQIFRNDPTRSVTVF